MACGFANTQDCSDNLLAKCNEVLTQYFMHGKTFNHIFAVSDYEGYVLNAMHEIGIPAHLNGYGFIRAAVLLVIKNHEYMSAVTCSLYPDVAKEFNTTPSRVERGIRHAIEVAWNRGDVDVLNRYFGNTLDPNRGKPTNSEFIATLAELAKRHFRGYSM